jgi:hypothetical protein
MAQKFLTAEIKRKLLANGRADTAAIAKDGNTPDHFPVLKLFNPTGGATWLISSLDADGDTMFGLCDLGIGCVELGSVSMNELLNVRVRMGLKIERDMWFKADKPLSAYAEEGRRLGRIAA